ncbi:MAG TPA: 5-(carboxyamino)imidazole ribonucleotide mutase [Candidatus Krumholzibacteria bacterium]|nr:5-(carboxyamino)imidazole ribonucleotide mutase [Candidatus Krumholzibacteria bacterium]
MTDTWTEAPRVLLLIGSESDRPEMEKALPLLDRFGLSHRLEVASAHRQPARLHTLLAAAETGGTEVFIAGAGMAAHLPGVVASLTLKPVIGVPFASGPLAGFDALMSIVQMPPGVPVATVAVGGAGARNAAVLAARILALKDAAVAAKLEAYRDELAEGGR